MSEAKIQYISEIQYLLSQAEKQITRINSLRRTVMELDVKIAEKRALIEKHQNQAHSGIETDYPGDDDKIVFLKIKRFFAKKLLKMAERKLQRPRPKRRN